MADQDKDLWVDPAKAAHEAKIAEMSQGMVSIAGLYDRSRPAALKIDPAAISTWTRGSEYSRLYAAVAEIDGTPALILSYGNYDDYRDVTFISRATRDLIFAARLAGEMRNKGLTLAEAAEYYRAEAERYGGYQGAYATEFTAWIVNRAALGDPHP